jgi:hypothetical protein
MAHLAIGLLAVAVLGLGIHPEFLLKPLRVAVEGAAYLGGR